MTGKQQDIQETTKQSGKSKIIPISNLNIDWLNSPVKRHALSE